MVKFSLLAVALTVFLATNVNSVSYTVEVGKGDENVFSPDTFDANVGDNVVFKFVGGTHNVIESDEAKSCVKSAKANAFFTEQNTGSVDNAPEFVWKLEEVGPKYYFCSVATHCKVGKMYATINVLEAGKAPKAPGVEQPDPAPEVKQPPVPADDAPNVPKAKSTPTPSETKSTTSETGKTAPSTQAKPNNAVTFDRQVSVAVVGALLSCASYFL